VDVIAGRPDGLDGGARLCTGRRKPGVRARARRDRARRRAVPWPNNAALYYRNADEALADKVLLSRACAQAPSDDVKEVNGEVDFTISFNGASTRTPQAIRRSCSAGVPVVLEGHFGRLL
jgi:hypothetical protein